MHTALQALFLKGLLRALAALFAALWSTSDMAATVLEWRKDLAPVVVSIAVLFVTLSFNRWQVRLGKEKLRHDLYERRFAIYLAFKELLLGLPEKPDAEIKTALRKASVARFEVSFLLADDSKIQAQLDEICKQVSDDVIANIMFIDAMNENPAMKSDPRVIRDFNERASRLSVAKLNITNRYLGELPQLFKPFLRLTDFSEK
ncbi:MAG: hypothetical protein WBY44_32285 [Bryobacteraceae bacterium]|jgi:hypothetical protein